MDLLEDIVFALLMICVVASFARAFVCHFFERHFNGVRFPGRYVIADRPYKLSEITHPNVKRAMYVIYTLIYASGVLFALTALLLIVLKATA